MTDGAAASTGGGPPTGDGPSRADRPVETEACDDAEATLDPTFREFPRLVIGAVRIVAAAGRRQLLTVVGLQVLVAAGLGVAVLAGRRVLDGIVSVDTADGAVSDLLPAAGLLALIVILSGAASAILREQEEVLRELTTRHVQNRVMDVTSQAELVTFDEPAFHDSVARALTNSPIRSFNLVSGLARMAGAAAAVVSLSVALATLAPILLPAVVVVFVPAYLLTSRRGRAYYEFTRRATPKDRERDYILTLLTAREPAQEVRAFRLAPFLRARHARLWGLRVADLRGVVRRQMLYTIVANLAAAAIIGGLLALLVWLTTTESFSVADSAAAAGAIVLLGTQLFQAGEGMGLLFEAALFVEEFLAFTERGRQAHSERGTVVPDDQPSSYTMRDVSFTYPTGARPALDGVTLELGRGEVVALVGENGSGKTTIAKLLSGLYLPSEGSVSWGDVDTREADLDELRRSVGVIFQDFVKYNLTARDNIALGRHEDYEDDERVSRAADLAGVAEIVERLPNGFATLLGPAYLDGTDLSVGQWQRMALARAFFRDAPLVILDEPTAALDARAEAELFQSLRRLLQNKTVLLISHRFSSVRSADRIYVLEHGRVVESGTHERLVTANGLYASLYNLQADAYLRGALG